MSIVTSARGIESTTGVATPTTSADGLEDHLRLQEWLHSSGLTSSRPSSNNSPQSVTRMLNPYPGGTFLTVDKSNKRVLASKGRHLHLEDARPTDSGESIPESWQWLCTENDGFKGFKNVSEAGFWS
ncbi:hypothetical protein NM208_g9635 [Fusarium decemcellulare]|uniref:Uncharacterized protein n=1 Tax=Fusarium decemcellulare TaxID=57161 RepID=A0ACC1S136_9HYPO|nr:hypothetical protein NM208_g9635 [Fusarium decemcellulare]